jgi:hypothetical protein
MRVAVTAPSHVSLLLHRGYLGRGRGSASPRPRLRRGVFVYARCIGYSRARYGAGHATHRRAEGATYSSARQGSSTGSANTLLRRRASNNHQAQSAQDNDAR